VVGNPPLDRIEAVKTIANFWGYPTTVFDFIRRAMPATQPRTLTADQVYALVAYIFAENKLIGEADVMNAETLPKVKMPNRDNFIIRFPDRI
jgi:cytochrome c